LNASTMFTEVIDPEASTSKWLNRAVSLSAEMLLVFADPDIKSL
jgi:hypothetical protein